MNQPIQFMHYRKFSENGPDSRGGATVAILPGENGTAMIAVAQCNPSDVFNKKVGRAISSGRINAYLKGRTSLDGKVQTITVVDLLQLREAVDAVVHDSMDANDLY